MEVSNFRGNVDEIIRQTRKADGARTTILNSRRSIFSGIFVNLMAKKHKLPAVC